MSETTIGLLVGGTLGEQTKKWLQTRNKVDLYIFEPSDKINKIKQHKVELLISAGYPHILPEDVLKIPEKGAINLHPSYLPYGRGKHHNIWALVNDEPAGVSIHYMNEKLDGGPIIARQKVPTYPEDTGRDLFDRLINAQVNLLVDEWESIIDGSADCISNQPVEGTYYSQADFEQLQKINLNTQVRVGKFIDKIRGLTFPPHQNAYFCKNGKKYYININIEQADESDDCSKSED